MAERFFKKEVQKLYLGEGQEFHNALAELNLSPGGAQ